MQSLHDYCYYLSIELLWAWLRTTGWHRLAHSFLSAWLSSADSVDDAPCWAYHMRHSSPTSWSLLYLSSLHSVQDVITSYLHPFSFTFLLVGCASLLPPSFTCFNLQKLLLPYKVSDEVYELKLQPVGGCSLTTGFQGHLLVQLQWNVSPLQLLWLHLEPGLSWLYQLVTRDSSTHGVWAEEEALGQLWEMSEPRPSFRVSFCSDSHSKLAICHKGHNSTLRCKI